MYIWNTETQAWESVGNLQGPPGDTGAVGTILGSYDTVEELRREHPTGNQGDAYLVGGELYIWNTETQTWESVGNLQGPPGDTGAVGTILGSYDTVEELRREHPTGNQGDAYLAGGELYIWNTETQAWESVGNLQGPAGPQGPPGEDGADGIIGQIEGVVENIADLPTTGVETGTIFYVGEDDGVYIWDAATGEWTRISLATGPRGATGPQGPSGADGVMGTIEGVVENVADLPATGITQGTIYYVEGDGLYVWDDEEGWISLGMIQGPRGIPGPEGPEGPAGPQGPAGNPATSVTIIPFASQQGPHVATNNGGLPVNVALIGFGYMQDAELEVVIDTNDRSFNLTQTANRQVAFSLPFDMKLNSIYATVGNYDEFPLPPSGTLVYPYVQVYAAAAGTNSFSPIADAFARPEQGIDPQSALEATMRAASKDGLDIGLRAGTRIAICGMMEITGDTLARQYYLYFTGGIGMSRWIE